MGGVHRLACILPVPHEQALPAAAFLDDARGRFYTFNALQLPAGAWISRRRAPAGRRSHTMFKALKDNFQDVRARDPAARSILEILLCYPGVHAIAGYRVAHWLWKRRLHLLGRLISHLTRFFTGIEIHPGATIGRRLFIDHGMGVVIGETSEIGDDCFLYQGVTLGGTSLSPGKRHPTLDDGVIVGAGAKVLGPITLGKGVRVGANAVVLKNVPENVSVAGIPAREIGTKPLRSADDGSTAYGPPTDNSDPALNALDRYSKELEHLAAEIEEMKNGYSKLRSRKASGEG